MRKTIYVQTSFVGFHRWKDAPLKVLFLQDIHRHIFHVKVTVSVTHNDRDIEFFLLKEEVNFVISRFEDSEYDGKAVGSCEMVAEQIIASLKMLEYPVISVEVSEDQENGSIIYND